MNGPNVHESDPQVEQPTNRAGLRVHRLFPIEQQWIDSEHSEDCARGFVAAGWQRMN